MKKVFTLAATALLLGSLTSTALADGHLKQAAEARQSAMKLYAFSLGQLGAMVKGEIPYDAAAAEGAAKNLLALATLDQSAFWSAGSGSDGALGSMTRAKPEIWSTYPAVVEKSKAMVAAAEEMAAAAGTGVDGIKANIGKVGGACKACHDDFRGPKQ